jgi:hypothetical protein
MNMIINTSETAYQQGKQEEVFKEQLETLRKSDVKSYMDYKRIEEYNGIQQYESFKEAADAMIEEVNKMQGPLYTQEGKNAQIRENIDKLAEKYIQEEQDLVAGLNSSLETLKQKLNDDLNESMYTNSEETRLKMQDLEAETRSALAFATDARSVEGIMRQLVERGERDQVAARFVSKHAYLFAEKAASLADEYDRAISLSHIKGLAEKAKSRAYSQKSQARLAVLEKLEKQQWIGGASRRLIEMNAKSAKSRYQ